MLQICIDKRDHNFCKKKRTLSSEKRNEFWTNFYLKTDYKANLLLKKYLSAKNKKLINNTQI